MRRRDFFKAFGALLGASFGATAGSLAEAYVPLPDGRSIQVSLRTPAATKISVDWSKPTGRKIVPFITDFIQPNERVQKP
jgi:hypothetical protein